MTARTIRRWRAELRKFHLLDIGRPVQHYTLVPVEVLTNPELSVGARVLYMTLAWLSDKEDWVLLGQDTLARHLRIGRAAITRRIAELEAAGLLTVSRASYSDALGQRFKCNRYRLLPDGRGDEDGD